MNTVYKSFNVLHAKRVKVTLRNEYTCFYAPCPVDSTFSERIWLPFISPHTWRIGFYCSVMLITVIMTPSTSFAHPDSRNKTFLFKVFISGRGNMISSPGAEAFHIAPHLVFFLPPLIYFTCKVNEIWYFLIKISIFLSPSESNLKPARA